MKKRVTKLVLVFVVVTHTLALLVGCSDKQPARVAWLSVEKPPIKVIYIDEQGNLDPVITTKVFDIVGQTRYHNIKINENTNVSVTASSHQSDAESDSDSSSTTIQGI
jgi:hypothetical protein